MMISQFPKRGADERGWGVIFVGVRTDGGGGGVINLEISFTNSNL